MTFKNRLGITVLPRITALTRITVLSRIIVLTRITVLISLVLAINGLNFLIPHVSQAQYEPNLLNLNFPVELNSFWWGNYTSLDFYNYPADYAAYYPAYLSDMAWGNDGFSFTQAMNGFAYQWGNYMWGENLTARSSSNDQAGYTSPQGSIQGNTFYSDWQLGARSRQADSYSGDGMYGGLGSIMGGVLPSGPTVPYANPGSSDGFYCVYPYPGAGFGVCSMVPRTAEQWRENQKEIMKNWYGIVREEVCVNKDGQELYLH